MIPKPQRYFVSIGLLLLVSGLALRALTSERGGVDFFVGLLMGAGLMLELVGLWLARRRS